MEFGISFEHGKKETPAERIDTCHAVTAPPSDYVVLDIETTGLDPYSCEVIEIGAIRYENHAETARYHTFVHPNTPIPGNITRLTHITMDDVKDAPSFTEANEELTAFIGDSVIVGYNVRFDLSFLQTRRCSPFCNGYFDVLPLVKETVKLDNYKLEHIRAAMGLSGIAHSALGDCEATAQLYQRCLCRDVGDVVSEAPKVPRRKKAYSTHNNVKVSDITPTTELFNTTHPFYGKNLVFTGTLSMERAEAMQLAVNVGACIKSSVSGKTHYLIVGEQDTAVVGDDGMSCKEEKAYALNASGKADIKILSEHEFLLLVQRNAPVPDDGFYSYSDLM